MDETSSMALQIFERVKSRSSTEKFQIESYPWLRDGIPTHWMLYMVTEMRGGLMVMFRVEEQARDYKKMIQ